MQYKLQHPISVLCLQVCDAVADCHYMEDERYCLNLFNSDSVVYMSDGRPQRPVTGLLALNRKGIWNPVCTKAWTKDLNDQVCRCVVTTHLCLLNSRVCTVFTLRYMGRKGGISHTLIPFSNFGHLSSGSPLKIRWHNNKVPVYPRPTNSPIRSKRQADHPGEECSLIQVRNHSKFYARCIVRCVILAGHV